MSAEKKRPARRAKSVPGIRKPKKRPEREPEAVSVEAVAARLLALPQAAGPLPALWRKTELARALPRAEKTYLDAALARLQEERRLVAFDHGGNVFFAWAEPLRGWLAASVVAASPASMKPAVATTVDLMDAYRRLVRESGGFPDVKISTLARALGPSAAEGLPERLIGAWRTGDAMLSLGDWSLANDEMRAAAVELDGEKYLLVRFEE